MTMPAAMTKVAKSRTSTAPMERQPTQAAVEIAVPAVQADPVALVAVAAVAVVVQVAAVDADQVVVAATADPSNKQCR